MFDKKWFHFFLKVDVFLVKRKGFIFVKIVAENSYILGRYANLQMLKSLYILQIYFMYKIYIMHKYMFYYSLYECIYNKPKAKLYILI